jgi:hypothetical protein
MKQQAHHCSGIVAGRALDEIFEAQSVKLLVPRQLRCPRIH